MKKFLLGILFTLISVIGSSQMVTQQGWKVENEGYWGSFYWNVLRTVNPDFQGKYGYYIYFFSNSYFNSKSDGYNYDKASTYIRNIDITMRDYKPSYNNKLVMSSKVYLNLPSFTCDWFYEPNYYGAVFWSYYPYAKFTITFDEASAFDYSISK